MKKKELEELVLGISEDLANLEEDFFNLKSKLESPTNKKNVKYFEISCDNVNINAETLKRIIENYYSSSVKVLNLNVKEK